MDYRNLLLEYKNSVAILTINRPDKMNALNSETLDELKSAFVLLKENKKIKVVIITGAGEKAFVAGADISEINKLDMITGKEFAEKGESIFNMIANFEKPVIAAVNGYALGGGCELALASHIRLASENAKFGQPEVNLGIIPGYGGTQRLTRLVNKGRAMEYILTGDIIGAHDALRIGLVNHLFPEKEFLAKVQEMAEKIASKPKQALKMAIKAINASDEVSLKQGQNYEAVLFSLCCGTEDFKEGTNAFLEKRQPLFKDK
jgi:enoyl-CoA hydratase